MKHMFKESFWTTGNQKNDHEPDSIRNIPCTGRGTFLLNATKIIIQVFNNLSQPQWEKTYGHLVPNMIDSYNVYSYLLNRK